MSNVLNIVTKDISRLKIMLILWLLVLGLQFVFQIFLEANEMAGSDVLMPMKQYFYGMLPMLFKGLGILFVIVLIPLIIHGDPLVGTTSFWVTRPISRRQLLGVKMLLLLTALVLLPLAVEVSEFFVHDISTESIALLIPEVVITQLAFIVPIIIVAAITQNFIRFVTIGIVIYLVMLLMSMVGWLYGSFFSSAYVGFGGDHLDTFSQLDKKASSLEASSQVARDIFIIGLGGFAIVVQFMTRRTWLTVSVFVVMLLGSILIKFMWSYNFFEASTTKPDLLAHSADIAIELDPRQVIVSESRDLFGEGRGREKTFSTKIRVTGLDETQFGIINFLHRVVLTLPSGIKVKSKPVLSIDPDDQEFEMLSQEPYYEALRNVFANVTLLNMRADAKHYAKVFQLGETDFEKHKGQSGSYFGKASFDIYQYQHTLTLPLNAGEKVSYHNQQLVINNIIREEGRTKVVIDKKETNLLFDQTIPKFDLKYDISEYMYRPGSVYILVNDERNEALIADQSALLEMERFLLAMYGLEPRLFTNTKTLSFSYALLNSSKDTVIDKAWLDGAKLVRVDAALVSNKDDIEIKSEKFTLVPRSTKSEAIDDK